MRESFLEWQVHWRADDHAWQGSRFSRILTPALEPHHAALPPEIGLLLPTRSAFEGLVVPPLPPDARKQTVIGVFFGNPFLKASYVERTLNRAGISWVANLPSICQHDEEFVETLSDVGIGAAAEFKQFARFLRLGFHGLGVVSSARDATLALQAGAEALLVMPRVGEFGAGFPSGRARSERVWEVRDAVPEFTGPIFEFGTDAEALHPGIWPKGIAGMIERPRPLRGV